MREITVVFIFYWMGRIFTGALILIAMIEENGLPVINICECSSKILLENRFWWGGQMCTPFSKSSMLLLQFLSKVMANTMTKSNLGFEMVYWLQSQVTVHHYRKSRSGLKADQLGRKSLHLQAQWEPWRTWLASWLTNIELSY